MSGDSAAPDVRLAPMAAEDFADWSARSVRGFAGQLVAAGLDDEPGATAYARRQLDALLPRGLLTPAHFLWTVARGGAPVGDAWLQLRQRPADVQGYLLDLEIAAVHRGRGLGRATVLAVEDRARRRGAVELSLSVFGHNEPARALYRSLGYAVTEATWTLALPGAAPPGARPGAAEVVLREMTAPHYRALRPALLEQHGAGLDRLLPFGPASAGHRLWTAHAGSATVGAVWLQVQPRADGLHALVRHVEVDRALHRAGGEPAVLDAVHRVARDLGVRSLTVVLRGPAETARALVDRCGFALVAQTLAKALQPDGTPTR